MITEQLAALGFGVIIGWFIILGCREIRDMISSIQKSKGERDAKLQKLHEPTELDKVNDWLREHSGTKHDNIFLKVPAEESFNPSGYKVDKFKDIPVGPNGVQLEMDEYSVAAVEMFGGESKVLATYTGVPGESYAVLTVQYLDMTYVVAVEFLNDGTPKIHQDITQCNPYAVYSANIQTLWNYVSEVKDGQIVISYQHPDTSAIVTDTFNNTDIKYIKVENKENGLHLVIKNQFEDPSLNDTFCVLFEDINTIELPQYNNGAVFEPMDNFSYGYFQSIN